MSIAPERIRELDGMCRKFRIRLIDMLHKVGTGHPGGSLSATEIVTTLYFEKMNIQPQDPLWQKRDRFIMGKGHAAPILYIVLAENEFFCDEDLDNLRQIDSILQGHPCVKTTPGIELSTGPLGLGLSAGLGMALAAKMDGEDYYTYVLMGDGENQEGIIWEAAMTGAKYGLDNCIAILDNNGVQLDGTLEEIMPMGDLAAKWAAFGWNVIHCDGHDIGQISDAIDKAKSVKGKPSIIIAKTVKGKGVSFMEGQSAWHGKPIGPDDYKQAMKELQGAAK